jgi:hypothetical protein
MDAPPAIPSGEEKRQNPILDIVFRTVACVAVGVIGFWYPLWVDRNSDESTDSRIGMLFCWSLPMILGFALWATAGLLASGRGLPGPRRRAWFALVAGTVALYWSPIVYVGFGMARAMLRDPR